MELTDIQADWLKGKAGKARKMAMSLLVDLGDAIGAKRLIPITAAHIAGVSYLTGGEGLLSFLEELTEEDSGRVMVPSTLNPCGYDLEQREQMHIKDQFIDKQKRILEAYRNMGVFLTFSCTPYEAGGPVPTKTKVAWAESSAIAYANSILGAHTNRESGLTALAAALTGFTPEYGLHIKENRAPNVKISASGFSSATDLSFLGEMAGKELKSRSFPFGPIPIVEGLENMDHFRLKALVAALATFNCALAHVKEATPEAKDFEDISPDIHLQYTKEDLERWYQEAAPTTQPDLIVIGCPQASLVEVQKVASMLQKNTLHPEIELWVFTSRANKAICKTTGIAETIQKAGALLVSDTCPEVVPYDSQRFKRILTNSLKAAHYIPSKLNNTPAYVADLERCIKIAIGTEKLPKTPIQTSVSKEENKPAAPQKNAKTAIKNRQNTLQGKGLISQTTLEVEGEALVTTEPITLLGFVDRTTGVISEKEHPLNGQSIGGKIFVYPTGAGSTVAPYVLLELIYRGLAPKAILNRDLDQGTLAACSIKGLPFAYSFDHDPTLHIASGDKIKLKIENGKATVAKLGNK